MKISDFTKSNYFTAQEVVDNPNVPAIIITEAILITKEFEGKPNQKLQFTAEFNKVEYTIELGKINSRLIAEKLGDDTVKWIGHKIFFETYKQRALSGKNKGNLVNALNISKVE